jgi:transposase
MSATKVAQYFGVCDNTIRNWNQKYLTAVLKEPDFDNLQYLLVDEKSIGKGHSYVTVVLNALNGELLHMAEGKKHDSLKSFFDKLTSEQKCRIRAVCIDRNGTYAACIEENLPQAQIAYDKFHLVKNLNDVIDKIRVDLWHQARREGDRTSADIIKGQKYNLLRNRKNNTASQQQRLDELLKVNAPLSEAYLLLESFKHTLSSIDRVQMHKDLIEWIQMAGRSCRKEMRKFAKNLSDVVENVVNAVKYRLNNGLIERFNGKIAMVIRRACGCKNLDYLFLNLRQLAKKPIPL